MTEAARSCGFTTEIDVVPEFRHVRKLRIVGRVTYREAAELRDIVFAEVRRPGTSRFLVDLGAVERMDTAGMAVLVEALLASKVRNVGMLLCEPSESVLQIFRLAGFPDILASCCSGFEEVQRKLRD